MAGAEGGALRRLSRAAPGPRAASPRADHRHGETGGELRARPEHTRRLAPETRERHVAGGTLACHYRSCSKGLGPKRGGGLASVHRKKNVLCFCFQCERKPTKRSQRYRREAQDELSIDAQNLGKWQKGGASPLSTAGPPLPWERPRPLGCLTPQTVPNPLFLHSLHVEIKFNV